MEARNYSTARRLAAWGVHAYTGLGLPLALASVVALAHGDGGLFFVLNTVAMLVDATDGVMARAVKVKEVLPAFNGRKLDDIIDFLTFAFLPCLAMPALGIVPASIGWIVVFPLMASGYGFCQEAAKTDDAFVGFPSYWNIIALYLYILRPAPWLTCAILLVFAVLVFVPIHYIYPTRTLLLRKTTLVLAIPFTVLAFVLAWFPSETWSKPLALVSLAYPVYYFALSGVHHVRVMRRHAS